MTPENNGGYVLTVLLVLGMWSCGGEEMTLQELADEVGCLGFEREAEPAERFVRDRARCEDPDVTLRTFSVESVRDAWEEDTVGRRDGPIVVGENWVVEANSQELAAEVKGRIGGKIVR